MAIRFDMTVYPGGEEMAVGPAVELRGRKFVTLRPTGEQLGRPLPGTFEQAADKLQQLDERMIFEPDGSFVWTGGRPTEWQIDGMLYDRNGRLLYVELKGRCPDEPLRRLLACFGWPATPLMFQLRHEGVFLDEAAFWLYAGN